MSAIVISRNAAMDVSYHNSQKGWRTILIIRISRNAGDEFQQLYFPEMPTLHVNNYNFQKGWRQLLASILFQKC